MNKGSSPETSGCRQQGLEEEICTLLSLSAHPTCNSKQAAGEGEEPGQSLVIFPPQ